MPPETRIGRASGAKTEVSGLAKASGLKSDISDDGALRNAIIATCLKMNAEGLNQGTSGNVSARICGGMLVTPSGVPYDAMTPPMIVTVDGDGGWAGDVKPSSEWRMHLDI